MHQENIRNIFQIKSAYPVAAVLETCPFLFLSEVLTLLPRDKSSSKCPLYACLTAWLPACLSASRQGSLKKLAQS